MRQKNHDRKVLVVMMLTIQQNTKRISFGTILYSGIKNSHPTHPVVTHGSWRCHHPRRSHHSGRQSHPRRWRRWHHTGGRRGHHARWWRWWGIVLPVWLLIVLLTSWWRGRRRWWTGRHATVSKNVLEHFRIFGQKYRYSFIKVYLITCHIK